MPKREQVDRIELPVEQLSYSSPPVDHLQAARRVWSVTQRTAQAVTAEHVGVGTSSASDDPAITFRSTTFRRLIDVPGDRLDAILDAWWSRSDHDDGHLRVDRVSCRNGLFELRGSLRKAAISRRIPVVIWLSPYLGMWTFLELTPQRPTHAGRFYFRIGHNSLDRFVAALCALV